MPTWKNYHLASTIQDALEALRIGPGPARPVSGGTDLLLELQQGHHPPVETLVDLSRIPELGCLETRGSQLFIGAGVPVAQAAESALIRRHAQAVSEACALIGGPQVRNTATLGGNVAHALPAADGMIALVAQGAVAEIASSDGDCVVLRRAPILSLFRGPGQSTLVVDREILTGFYLPLREQGQASAFDRVMRPQGVALPILNIAIWLQRESNRIADIRIAVGPAGPVPQRAAAVEEVLRGAAFGSPASVEILDKTRAAWNSGMRFRTSPQRATSGYRHHLSSVLFERVLETAWERAAVLMVEE
jgi:xanthine dehydrogenase FAD-binding subunit